MKKLGVNVYKKEMISSPTREDILLLTGVYKANWSEDDKLVLFKNLYDFDFPIDELEKSVLTKREIDNLLFMRLTTPPTDVVDGKYVKKFKTKQTDATSALRGTTIANKIEYKEIASLYKNI
jgi:hypothetical protein